MSASIHALLADELDITEQTAQKLLSAMLREVRKRAERGGVRLPDLGKFKVEDGELAFHPAEGLARAVNHRFEGLESEDLRGAPDPDPEDEKDPDGPSTITLGYQDTGGWTPLDAPDDADQAAENAAEDDEEADTEEFEVPGAGPPSETAEAPPSASASASSPPEEPDAPEAPSSSPERPASASPSTDAASTDAASPEAAPSAPGSEPASEPADASEDASEDEDGSPDTEELYPLVDEISDEPAEDDAEPAPTPSSEAPSAPEEPTPSDRATDEERDELSKIWESGPDEEAPAFSSDEPADREQTDDGEPEPSTADTSWEDLPSEPEVPAGESDAPSPSRDDSEAATDPDGTEAPSDAPDAAPEPSREPSPPSENGASTLPRVLVTLLVLALLGGGAWYILGQRGLVPSPGQTVSEIGGASSDPAPDQQAASQQAATASPSSSDGTSGQDAPSSSEVSEEGPDASSEGAPSTAGIDPAAGGWTIVVASRADRSAAESLVDTYRRRFETQALPVSVLQGTVDNATRYRVGVGQFSSRSEARSFLDDNSDALPSGAWPLDLQ